MRTMVWLGAILASATTPLTALSQELSPDRPTIVVVGTGHAEQTPDIFTVTASLYGRGHDRVAALRQLSEAQARFNSGLPGLEGLSRGDLSTGAVEVEPVREPCREDDYDQSNCPVTGYLATMSVAFNGSPVDRAGDAVSLASELGADDVSFSGGSVSDRAGLRSEANSAAFADARRQAEALAAASGQRIVRTLRVHDARYRPDTPTTEVDEIVVVSSRRRPAVRLDVAPPPVRVESQLTVVFEVE